MLYAGFLSGQKSHTFETLDLDTGLWTLLDPTLLGFPHLPNLVPFGHYGMARKGVMAYYDDTWGSRNIHIYADGNWGKTVAAEDGLLYSSRAEYRLIPRKFACGG